MSETNGNWSTEIQMNMVWRIHDISSHDLELHTVACDYALNCVNVIAREKTSNAINDSFIPTVVVHLYHIHNLILF